MNKFTYTFIFSLVVCLLVSLKYCDKYKTEADRLSVNQQTLLTDLEHYRASDSTNAAKVGILTLELDEYKQYRAEDLQTIKEMGIKVSNLQSVTAAQTATIRQIRGSVRDSVIYVDRLTIDTLKCVRIEDKWLDLDVCLSDDGTYCGEICSRDSLLIVSEVKYKRFLGFLWKTNRVKSRKVHVTSKNPHTIIEGFEYIEIK